MLVGSAYGKVTLDTSGVQTGVNQAVGSLKTLQGAAMQIGQTMQQAGQMLTIGLTLPIVAAGGAAIKMASDLEETKSKVKVIFGSMSNDMLEWAETANTTLGQTRQQALDAASTFALFGKAAGKSGADLNTFAQQNVQFAADFASFYNTNPEDAITAIGAAYRGESEPIRRYNILLNDQIIKQKAMALSLYNGNGQLSQQARIMAVNAIITEQGSAAMGDFARTSGGLANQTRILQAQFKDSLAMLGQNLLPIAVQVVKWLNMLLTAFQKLPAPVQQGILIFAGLLAILGPVLSLLGTVLTTVSSLSTAWPAISAAMAAAGPIFASIGAVITGTVIPAIGAFLVAAAPIILTIGLIVGAIALLYWAFSTNFMGITDTVKMLGVIIPFYINKMWQDVQLAFTNAFNNLRQRAAQIRDAIVNAFKIDWGQIGRNIIAGITAGIINGIATIVDAAKRAAQAALDAFKKALGIKSPSAEFRFAGQMSGLGYVQGLTTAIDPNTIAKIATRPVQQTNNRAINHQQTFNFPGGLTIQERRRIQSEAEDRSIERMVMMMGATA